MQNALEQHLLNPERPWLPKKWDLEADVVVVGYGGAGSCACIAAHDAGDKVLALEKAPIGGGNTGCSGGGMRIPTDIPNAVKYYRALTQGTVEEESLIALAEAMHGLPARLEAWGATLEWTDRGKSAYPSLPGSSAFNMVANLSRSAKEKAQQEGGPIYLVRGNGLFEFLDGQVKQRRIDVRFSTPAKRLIQDPTTKEILGVAAGGREAGELIYVKARKAVLLTCGGFQNNHEMLVNFVPHLTALPIYPYGTPYNTGDGIVMASAVGAKLWHMCGVEMGMFAPRIPSEQYGLGFRLEKTLRPGAQAIFVNGSGKRFMDESVLLSHRKDLFKVQAFSEEEAGFPNIPLFMIFDDAYRRERPIVGGHMGWWWVQKTYQWSEDNMAEVNLGWIKQAPTIKLLAEKIKVDALALTQTVEKYNRDCERGVDSQFGRTGKCLAPLVTGPFYATELCEPIINTQGGPKRNGRSQVMDHDDNPIPRLYAAGELGSFFYPLYEGASNVPEALALGIAAAEDATKLSCWDTQAGALPL